MDDNKTKILDIYSELLQEQTSFIKELYASTFSNLDNQILSEIYKTYYAKNYLQSAFVYFIYNKYTNLIKIGKSSNPFKRLNELNSMFKNHFGVADALEVIRIIFVPTGKDYTVEKMYHEKFADYRTFGEWFNMNKDIICDILPEFISYDTDGFLDNEGFKTNIRFELPKDEEFETFALDCLDYMTIKISEADENKAIVLKRFIYDEIIAKKYGIRNYKMFGTVDMRIIDKPFSSQSNNNVWEIFKWLFANQDKYSLSSHYKLDENGKLKKHVVGFNKDAEVLDYYELVENFVNNMCLMTE